MGPDANRNDRFPHVLLATARQAWELDEDAQALTQALEAAGISCAPAVWDDPEVDWSASELVVVRSTWDYARRRDQFLQWASSVDASTQLANPYPLIEWNTDKRYLHDLAEAGLPVVATSFASRGDPPDLTSALIESLADGGEFVVKPSVSAGSKDTGRFDSSNAADALHLARRIIDEGRTAMFQPYLGSVDHVGETGLVFFEGRFSHAFRKAALLAPGGEADHGLFALERIDPAIATRDQLELAQQVVQWSTGRFSTEPLYARVDLLEAEGGAPVLLELELTEPSWFLGTDPESPARAAAAIGSRLGRTAGA